MSCTHPNEKLSISCTRCGEYIRDACELIDERDAMRAVVEAAETAIIEAHSVGATLESRTAFDILDGYLARYRPDTLRKAE